jgi:hypothetical protein
MKAHFLFLVAVTASLLLGGCGQKPTPTLRAGDRTAFDKSPPEIKQLWDRALEADRTNDYVVAQNLLYGLSQQPLPLDQSGAVSNEIAVVSRRMYDSAEKGDAAALKAIQQLRRHPPNR